jgi:hypothetical protein
VLDSRGTGRVWLPAYICVSAVEGAAASGAEILFYPCDRTLRAELSAVARDLRSGDAVLGVDYFGRSVGNDFLELRNGRPDLLWIEDRAQALDTGRPAWGDVLIYSPRKLVGVGDGGLIFSQDDLPRPAAEGSSALWAPEDARALDPDGANPAGWRPLFQAREASLKVDRMSVSARTLEALGRVSARKIGNARRENWRVLAAALGEFALWGDLEPEFAPLAFPIVVEDIGSAVAALAELRIWTPRHWAELPSDPDEFPEAAWLSARASRCPRSALRRGGHGAGGGRGTHGGSTWGSAAIGREEVRRPSRGQPRVFGRVENGATDHRHDFAIRETPLEFEKSVFRNVLMPRPAAKIYDGRHPRSARWPRCRGIVGAIGVAHGIGGVEMANRDPSMLEPKRHPAIWPSTRASNAVNASIPARMAK